MILFPRLKSLFVSLIAVIGIVGIALFTLHPPAYIKSSDGVSLGSKVSSLLTAIPDSFSKHKDPPKFAFVAFLEEFSGANKAEDGGEEDAYYTATRVLGYQLMHAPSTRTTNSIPFIVVCASVSPHKRARLEKDGAIVVEVEEISDPEWIKTRQQWRGVMTKLRVFEQDQYEKLLFLDADMLIVRPLDDIFEDHGTRMETLPANVTSLADEGRLPPSYMLAGQAQQRDRQHPYPPPANEDWFCSGFFVFSPSQEMFNYYLSLVTLENRFDPFYPDQNLLNYAHRWDGPMPWTKFNYTWTTTFPTIKEYEMGAASLHEKYWLEEYRKEEFGQDVLGRMWLEAKGNMTEFYQQKDQRR